MRYSVFIKPGSTKGPLVEKNSEGRLVIYVRQPAIGGKANEAVIKLLAAYFDVPKSAVTVIRGHISRHKIIEIDGENRNT